MSAKGTAEAAVRAHVVAATPRGNGAKPGLRHARPPGAPRTFCGRLVTDTWSWSNARPEIATDENVECFTCLRRFPIAPVPPRPNGFHAAKAAIAAARGRGVQDQAALQAAAGKEIPSR